MTATQIMIHADIRHVELAELTAARFASCIMDPPYSPRVHERATSNGTNGAGPRERDLGFACLDAATRAAVARVAASCSRWGAVFSDIEGAHAWREALTGAGVEYIRAVPWVRWSQPQLSGDRPPSGCELVTLVHARSAKHWSGPGSLTAFDTRSLRGAEKYSCEKPLDLMLSLVSWFSDFGENVVDPCAGAGTTLRACALLGRDAVGFDVSADAVARTRARLASPLTAGERERCERWIAYQAAWLEHEAPSTTAGAARYARALADTARIVRALGG